MFRRIAATIAVVAATLAVAAPAAQAADSSPDGYVAPTLRSSWS